jgi:sec-independent protein translocase protein TatC
MTKTPEDLTAASLEDAPRNGKAAKAEKKAAKVAARASRKRGDMTLVEHLEELRSRILRSMLAVILGTVVGWFLYERVLSLLVSPYRKATGDPNKKLIFTGIAEPFLLKLKIAAYIGIVLALPIVLYQLWRFITPGLNPKERRYAIPFVVASVLLFALGGFFAYLTFPTALKFLVGFGGPDLQAFLTAERYLSFVTLMILAFGFSFEFPVVLQFLVIANIVKSRQLRDFRRWAILLITIFAAVITPSQDPLSMVLLGAPMIIFYEMVIWISHLFLKK